MKNLLKILLLSTLLNFTFSDENIYRENTLLFSLYKDIEPLDINEFYKTNYIELNDFLQNHDIIKIEPWLKSATEKDFDGDIYLNRIYRITISEKSKNNINNIMQSLKNIQIVQHTSRENLHKIFLHL